MADTLKKTNREIRKAEKRRAKSSNKRQPKKVQG